MQINNRAIPKEEADEVIDFYKRKFQKANIVTCDECGTDLAIEVLIPEKYAQMLKHTHHEGLTIIPIGDSLLASRKRPDGYMGYECRCGNDSRVGPGEKRAVGKGFRDPMPHEEERIKAQIQLSSAQPEVLTDDKGCVHVDKFKISKMK